MSQIAFVYLPAREAIMDASNDPADVGLLTIRHVCEELGVTSRALRFYETWGLVAPGRKSRQRFYRLTDVERLRAILKLKSLGLSLREIRELLQSPGDGPYGLNANWCKEVFMRLSAQRTEAEAGLVFLRDFVGCKCGIPEQRADRGLGAVN
jgi:DNA-binding transcriptional MerR regulator